MVSSSFVSIFVAALLIYLAFKILRGRRKPEGARKERAERAEIERWIDDALARELHRKLGLERDVILRALAEAPEPDAVGSMEEAVRAMQVKYAWNPDGSVDVRLDVNFEDGTSASTSRVFPRDAMPAGVKEEFKRTGAASVLRAVYFPWSTPD